jgi:predicted nucleic acid-binding protein
VVHYLDTSALVKLVVAEAQTPALRTWLSHSGRVPVTCDLSRTELLRAVKRVAPDRLVQAREVLDAVTVLEVTTTMFESAGRLDAVSLRTLDAIHLAAALSLGDDLDAIVTYDDRQAQAARANAVPVESPT